MNYEIIVAAIRAASEVQATAILLSVSPAPTPERMLICQNAARKIAAEVFQPVHYMTTKAMEGS